jgi:putative IMPACT (imprinted ancient) family translation regulator
MSAKIGNVGLVVVRCFGGTKLGKSGLIEMYGESARQCIEAAAIKPVEEAVTVVVKSSYDNLKTVDLLLSKVDSTRLASEYLEHVAITLRIQSKSIDRFRASLDQVAYTGIEYELGEPGLVFAESDT